MNPIISIEFAQNIPAWTIVLVSVSGGQIKDSRSIALLEFRDITSGVEPLFNDFKENFFRAQSLEHWTTQANTIYFDNLIYVLEKILPSYGLSYKVLNPPLPANIKSTGQFFLGLIK